MFCLFTLLLNLLYLITFFSKVSKLVLLQLNGSLSTTFVQVYVISEANCTSYYIREPLNVELFAGKYDPSNENPRKWKANFRCALNSLPDVIIVPSLCVRKGKEAYRVFKILPEKIPEKVRESMLNKAVF